MCGLISSDFLLTCITLNTCCHFARAAGSLEVGDVLSKDGAQVVFTDTLSIAFTSEGPDSHIDECGEPCSYAFKDKVSKGRNVRWQKREEHSPMHTNQRASFAVSRLRFSADCR
jgi:hypothetical protein